MNGICTLANDVVFDQAVALINSIERNAGKDMPICIYPYDDRLDRIRKFVAERPQVCLFEDQRIIYRWDNWVKQIWHQYAAVTQQSKHHGRPIHRMGTHRRLCAFEGPFDRFLYMDADTLLLDSPQLVFDYLETVDWVAYDFQHRDLSHVFNLNSPQLLQLFSPEQLQQRTFCSGFYGAKREAITQASMEFLLKQLAQGEAEILYPYAPDQTILNYLVLRSSLNVVNLVFALPNQELTGNSVTSSHFQEESYSVFDKGVKLMYLHYVGITAGFFAHLCHGKNIDIPYRNVFLNYRYLYSPTSRKRYQGNLIPLKPRRMNLLRRFYQKLSQSRQA